MDRNEQFRLWQIEEVQKLSDELSIIRNLITGQLMLKRISLPDSLEVMRTLSALSHPNLMRIYDADLIGGRCVCLCEYIEGSTLEDLIGSFGVYPETAAKNILASVCAGLSALHQHGLVHRDINPSNVMLNRQGVVKIIDYDIVRTVKPGQNKDTDILGTVGYTAPEQFGFQQTDRRADIYSCGVLLNFLLTGEIPSQRMYTGPLRSVIRRCIELDPQKRFDNADELRAALMSRKPYVYEEEGMQKSDEEPTFRPIPGFRSKRVFPKIMTVFGIILYVLALLIYILTLMSNEKRFREIGFPYVLANIFMMSEIFGFFTLFPYLLYGDVGKYTRIFTKDPYGRKVIKNILGTVCLIIGVILFFVMIHLYNKGYLTF